MDGKKRRDHTRDDSSSYTNDRKVLSVVDDEKPITVDGLLESVGGCGRFQVMLEIIICIIAFAMGFQNLLTYFIGHSPNWTCVHSVNVSNLECNIKGEADSSNAVLFNSRCHMDRHSWRYVTEKHYSLVTELDLVCNSSSLATLANSGFFIGWGISAIPLGILSDTVGRKPVFFASFATVMVATLALSFSTSFAQFFSLRVITGMGQSGFSLTSYILASENVSPRYRAATGNMLFIINVISFLVLDFQAYFVRKWRMLVLICSVPYLILIFFYFYIPESLRWLAGKKRMDKAQQVLERIAKTNERSQCNVSAALPRLCQKPTVRKGSVIDILCNRVLLFRSLNQGLAWFVCGMTYYGLSLASADLTGSMYRDFALTSIVEIPSIFMVIYGVERFGRKKLIPFSLCLSGLLCTLIAFVPEKSTLKGLPLLRVLFGMLGKFFNAVGFNGFYVWSTELYPTMIRTQGLSFVFFMARVGASSAPYIANRLRLIHPAIPFVLMGTASMSVGLFSAVLPETRGKPLPETLDDVLKGYSSKSPVEEKVDFTTPKSVEDTIEDSDNGEVYDEKTTLL